MPNSSFKQAKKKCLWCNSRQVSLFGKYDEDSNTCEPCLLERLDEVKPVYGQHTRIVNGEKEVHHKDILQPLKKDGTINKNFVSVHGTKSIEKEMKVSKREIMDNIEKYG